MQHRWFVVIMVVILPLVVLGQADEDAWEEDTSMPAVVPSLKVTEKAAAEKLVELRQQSSKDTPLVEQKERAPFQSVGDSDSAASEDLLQQITEIDTKLRKEHDQHADKMAHEKDRHQQEAQQLLEKRVATMKQLGKVSLVDYNPFSGGGCTSAHCNDDNSRRRQFCVTHKIPDCEGCSGRRRYTNYVANRRRACQGADSDSSSSGSTATRRRRGPAPYSAAPSTVRSLPSMSTLMMVTFAAWRLYY